jgi:hypothetical protein
MSVTTTDRTNAGTAYASALSAFIAAYATLAATERGLHRQGTAFSGGEFGAEMAAIDLTPFKHPLYAPTANASRMDDLVQAQLVALTGP